MDIKGHTVHRVLVDPGARHRARSTTSPSCSTGPTGPSSRWPPTRAAWRSSSSPSSGPEALAKVPVDAIAGVDEAKAARDRRRRGVPGGGRRPGRRRAGQAVGRPSSARTRRWSRSTRWPGSADGTVVALDGKVTLDDNADFRQPGNAELRRHSRRADPLEPRAKEKHLNYVKLDGEVGIIGNGAGLVMSHAGRGRLRRRAARRGRAGELPRHRRRRVGRGDGQRAGHHPQRPVGASGVRQRLRRHHLVRRGGQRHRRRASGCSGDEASKPLVVRLDGNNVEEGRRILTEAAHPLVTLVDTMDERRPTAELRTRRRRRKGTEHMAIFLTENSRIIVQGMTGSEGMKHTRRMLASGTHGGRRGERRARPAGRSTSTAPRCRCSAPSRRR